MIRFKTFLVLLFISGSICAQDSEYVFEDIIKLPSTQTKNQGKTGTCWSFATSSFIESEALRLKKDTLDLAEMFIVHHTYPKKARNYIKSKGKARLSEGGLSHDVAAVVADFGLMPQSAYVGKQYTCDTYDHRELNKVLQGIAESVLNTKGKSDVWLTAYEAVLDTYLGQVPAHFLYKGNWYTPKQFAREVVGFRPNDYVELSSFVAHDYYKQFALDVPDNWDKTDTYYNLPLEELMQVFDNALKQGFTIAWDGDVSEKEFLHAKGLAIFPQKKWSDKTKEEQKQTGVTYEEEAKVTEKTRQKLFDKKLSTDDHLMHIVGLAKDSKGRKYYRTKNSWGANSNAVNGYVYLSEAYIKAKTIAIMVHKDAIPAAIATKIFGTSR